MLSHLVARKYELLYLAPRVRVVGLGLEPLDDTRVLVIEARRCFFVLDGTDVLLDFPANDHDLPLAPILGDSTELGTALASCLQENRLVLALDQHRVHILNRLQLK